MQVPDHVLDYPDDGGLKEQVRPIEQTQSIYDVLEQARRQGMFRDKGKSVYQDASVLAREHKIRGHSVDQIIIDDLLEGPPAGHIVLNGVATPIASLTLNYEPLLGSLPPSDLPDRVDVTGTLTAYWTYDELYGPAWKRELMWFTHNTIAHPISEFTHWLGYLWTPLRDFGLWLHDITIPDHHPNHGRG